MISEFHVRVYRHGKRRKCSRLTPFTGREESVLCTRQNSHDTSIFRHRSFWVAQRRRISSRSGESGAQVASRSNSFPLHSKRFTPRALATQRLTTLGMTRSRDGN